MCIDFAEISHFPDAPFDLTFAACLSSLRIVRVGRWPNRPADPEYFRPAVLLKFKSHHSRERLMSSPNRTWLFPLIFIVILFSSQVLASQRASEKQSSDPHFTLEEVLSTPFPSDLVASPTGERFAWVFNWKGIRNIWVTEAPDWKARQLTQYKADDGLEVADLQFSADGNRIVYVRGGEKNAAGESPNPTSSAGGAIQQVWSVTWTGDSPQLLGDGNSPAVSPTGNEVIFNHGEELWITSISGGTPAKPMLSVRGESDSPQWSPDGKSVAFVSARSDHSFIAVYRLGSDSVAYMAPSVDRDSTPRWSADGKQIAFIRQPGRGGDPAPFLQERPNPWAIWIASVDQGTAKEIWHSSLDLAGSLSRQSEEMVLQWTAGNRILFTSEQDGWNHFYSIPASGGKETCLTPGKFEVEQGRLTPDRKYVVFSSNQVDIDLRHLWMVPVEGGKPIQLTFSPTISWEPAVSSDLKYLAFFSSDAFRPALPYVSEFFNEDNEDDLKFGSLKLTPHLVAPSDALENFPLEKLVQPQPALFKAADGLEIHGQLFLPRDGTPDSKYPAIIFMHGGPSRQMLVGWHYMYYYHNTYGMNQFLANHGYVVLSVNYRGGIGYGRSFRMAPNRGPRGASEYQDIVAAALYLRGRKDIEASRIGLWGGSYGGYLTALGLARNSDLFAAGVDLHGVHNWGLLASRFGPANTPDAAEARKVAEASSPVASISTWKSPVLLIQGDDDRNVSFSQMVDLVQRLRANNVPFEQIVFPDEIHDFLLQRTWLTTYHAAVEFFDRKLK